MKYDAFISYRHARLDTYVAKRIHKLLETFPVPYGIRKRSGKKKIARVFRDQEDRIVSEAFFSRRRLRNLAFIDAFIIMYFIVLIDEAQTIDKSRSSLADAFHDIDDVGTLLFVVHVGKKPGGMNARLAAEIIDADARIIGDRREAE